MRNAGRVLPRKLIEEKLYTWDEEVTSNAGRSACASSATQTR